MARAITKKSALLLYTTIREINPDVVVESGVANGTSTLMILSALNRNRRGKLYSIDINKDVGILLKGIDKRRWKLNIGKAGKIFSSTIKKLDKIDVFIHDSDHSYRNMQFEFNTIKGKINPKGVIISDDIHLNSSFFELAVNIGVKPKIYCSLLKSMGKLALADRST